MNALLILGVIALLLLTVSLVLAAGRRRVGPGVAPPELDESGEPVGLASQWPGLPGIDAAGVPVHIADQARSFLDDGKPGQAVAWVREQTGCSRRQATDYVEYLRQQRG